MAKFSDKRADGTKPETADTAADAPVPSADVITNVPDAEPAPVAATAPEAGATPDVVADQVFGTQPAATPAPAAEPEGDLPVQTDRPSYEQLLAAAQSGLSMTLRQIRPRPSNMTMVGGVSVNRTLKTISLAYVLDIGRSAIRELADDDTIEVYIVDKA